MLCPTEFNLATAQSTGPATKFAQNMLKCCATSSSTKPADCTTGPTKIQLEQSFTAPAKQNTSKRQRLTHKLQCHGEATVQPSKTLSLRNETARHVSKATIHAPGMLKTTLPSHSKRYFVRVPTARRIRHLRTLLQTQTNVRRTSVGQLLTQTPKWEPFCCAVMRCSRGRKAGRKLELTPTAQFPRKDG